MTDAEAIAKKHSVSEATMRRNPQIYGRPSPGMKAPEPICVPCCERDTEYHGYCDVHPKKPDRKPKKRLRQSSKPLMNKLESEFYEELKCHDVINIRIQAKRFKLGNGIWYKPDFTALSIDDHKENAYEVKGPHAFRGGFENLKVAAAQWPEVRFILVWKDNGQWQQQEILP